MKRLGKYIAGGALAGVVFTHGCAYVWCYDEVRRQGYDRPTCAATSAIYTGFISQPLAALGVIGGSIFGLGLGSIDYVVRKRRGLGTQSLEDKM